MQIGNVVAQERAGGRHMEAILEVFGRRCRELSRPLWFVDEFAKSFRHRGRILIGNENAGAPRLDDFLGASRSAGNKRQPGFHGFQHHDAEGLVA